MKIKSGQGQVGVYPRSRLPFTAADSYTCMTTHARNRLCHQFPTLRESPVVSGQVLPWFAKSLTYQTNGFYEPPAGIEPATN